jgi:hypothetical protein
MKVFNPNFIMITSIPYFMGLNFANLLF